MTAYPLTADPQSGSFEKHPADRPVRNAVAYTTSEGGNWIEGDPKTPDWHTLLWADGWAYDSALRKNGSGGARRVEHMPVFIKPPPEVEHNDPLEQIRVRLTRIERFLYGMSPPIGAK